MLIKANGAPAHLADGEFAPVGDDEVLPSGPVIVSLKRFLSEKDALLARNEKLGVKLDTSQSPESLAADIDRLAVIELHVPYFKDGRAYSWARLLRTRLGFTGEIRVSGHVLKDQLAFFSRVGADAFVLKQDLPIPDVQAALNEISLVYQPSADGRQTILDLRAARAQSAHQAP